jgi:hypothetical protein
MDKCLDTYDYPKFKQEDRNGLHRSETSNGIEAPKKKSQDPTDSVLNFTRPLKITNTNTFQTFP